MPSVLPFNLQTDETVLKDAPLISYDTVRRGDFVGTAIDTKKSVLTHAYLTDKRLVFIETQVKFEGSIIFGGDQKEVGFGNMLSDIPFNSIEAVSPNTSLLSKGVIDLAKRSPDGGINKISLVFIKGRGPERVPERDEWIRMIESYRKTAVENTVQPTAGDAEDPLKILKLRFAKGEITKDEYAEMSALL
jgi:hypothetical protein